MALRILLVAVLMALEIADIRLTDALVGHGGTEVNPLMVWSAAIFGLGYWWVPKAIVTGWVAAFISLRDRLTWPIFLIPVLAAIGPLSALRAYLVLKRF